MQACARPEAGAFVLVVEDDEDLAAALVDSLVLRGFDASAAHAVHEALRAAAVRAPDAWIIDYALPGVTGAELVEWLRGSFSPELRDAVLIGWSADPRACLSFARAGADGFVSKSEPCDELVAEIRSALARRHPVAAVP